MHGGQQLLNILYQQEILRHALDDFPSDPVEGEEHMVEDPNGKHSIETHKCCILSRMGAIDSSYMPRSFLNP